MNNNHLITKSWLNHHRGRKMFISMSHRITHHPIMIIFLSVCFSYQWWVWVWISLGFCSRALWMFGRYLWLIVSMLLRHLCYFWSYRYSLSLSVRQSLSGNHLSHTRTPIYSRYLPLNHSLIWPYYPIYSSVYPSMSNLYQSAMGIF